MYDLIRKISLVSAVCTYLHRFCFQVSYIYTLSIRECFHLYHLWLFLSRFGNFKIHQYRLLITILGIEKSSVFNSRPKTDLKILAREMGIFSLTTRNNNFLYYNVIFRFVTLNNTVKNWYFSPVYIILRRKINLA